MKTRFTELCGIQYPIMMGGMMWVGRAKLAAAVSNAGGLGTITALSQPSPDELVREIERVRDLTDRPFAVNITLLPSMRAIPYEEYCAAAIESGVRIIETAGRSPKDIVAMTKRAGVVLVHKCTSVRHAISAEACGVDVISIDGFECAGHPGEDDIPGLVLIPATVDKVRIPTIASGGFADGRGLIAAIALGADGINMGTRFCATQEAEIHYDCKAAIVSKSELDTNLIFRSLHNTARVAKTSLSDEVVRRLELPGATFADVAELVAGAKGKQALENGDLSSGLIWASLAQGLINDVPTVDALMTCIIAQARDIAKNIGRTSANP